MRAAEGWTVGRRAGGVAMALAVATAACDAIVGVGTFGSAPPVDDAGATDSGKRDAAHDASHPKTYDAGLDGAESGLHHPPDASEGDDAGGDAEADSSAPDDAALDAGGDADAGCEPGTQGTFGPCGNCGTLQKTCTPSRTWGDPSCMSQGVCSPDASTTTSCAMCGTITTPCQTDCTWGTPGPCTGQGACTTGEIMCDHFNGDGTLAFSCVGTATCGSSYASCLACEGQGAYWDWYVCDDTCQWNGTCAADSCSGSNPLCSE